MNRTATIAAIALSLSISQSVRGDEPATVARNAVEQSLSYLQEEGEWWISKKKCVSCHHTGYLIWSHELAANRGINVDRSRLEEWSNWAVGHQLSQRKDEEGNYQPGVVGSANIEGLAQLILGMPIGDHSSEFADFRELIRAAQQKDDSWKPGGQLPSQKRPAPETRAVSTMWAALALDAFGGDDARDRALAYLRANPIPDARSTEHEALNLILTSRFGDGAEAVAGLHRLLDRQNPDGGWSWVDGEPSGPMATGQALFALAEAGVDLEGFRSAIDHGRLFLATTQRKNGSWKTRSTKAPNKGKSTDVSDFFGSAWAVIGLCRTLPSRPPVSLSQGPLATGR